MEQKSVFLCGMIEVNIAKIWALSSCITKLQKSQNHLPVLQQNFTKNDVVPLLDATSRKCTVSRCVNSQKWVET